MTDSIISASIIGGIGDIIFGLEGFKEVHANVEGKTKCYLSTHAPEGISLVRANPYVDHVSVIEFKDNLSHFASLRQKVKLDPNYLGDARNFCFTINPEIILPDKIWLKAKSIKKSIMHNKDKPLIILHPCGSIFSKHFLGEIRNVSTKELDINIWQQIIYHLWNITEDPNIVLLGSKDDYDTLSAIRSTSESISIIAGDLSIMESISLITISDLVIGVDSFAKSISLAVQVPTIVFVNNHDDKFRDEVFLDPYKNTDYTKIIHEANMLDIDNLLDQISKFVTRKD